MSRRRPTPDEKVRNYLGRHHIHGPEDVRSLTARQRRRLRKRVNKAGSHRWAYLTVALWGRA